MKDNCIHILTQFVLTIKLSAKNTSSTLVENCVGTVQQNMRNIKEKSCLIHEDGVLGKWGGVY